MGGSPNRLLNIQSLAGSAPNPNPSPSPNPNPSPSPSPTPNQGFNKIGDGFCRTAAGTIGTFEVVAAADLDQCKAACSAQPTCVAIEFQTTTRCELHTQEITQVLANQGSVCFVKEATSTPAPPTDTTSAPETTQPVTTLPTSTAPGTTSPPQIRFVAEISSGKCSDVVDLQLMTKNCASEQQQC